MKGSAVSNNIIDFLADMNLNIQNYEHSAMMELLTCRENTMSSRPGFFKFLPMLSTFIVKPTHEHTATAQHTARTARSKHDVNSAENSIFIWGKSLKAFSDELAENDIVQDQMDWRTIFFFFFLIYFKFSDSLYHYMYNTIGYYN